MEQILLGTDYFNAPPCVLTAPLSLQIHFCPFESERVQAHYGEVDSIRMHAYLPGSYHLRIPERQLQEQLQTFENIRKSVSALHHNIEKRILRKFFSSVRVK